MAGKAGYSVGVSVVDNGASKVIDNISRRIHALTAPTEQFGKSLSKLGDVTGIHKLAEGFYSIGEGASAAFRSLDRMAGPMSAITGAASIAGMVELTRRWSEYGQQLEHTAYRMNTPVATLSRMRNAAQLAGVPVEALDTGLRGLQDTMSSAAWGQNPKAIQAFASIGVSPGTKGHLRQVRDVMGDIAEAIKGRPHETQAHMLADFGVGEGMLPMLKDGRKGWEDLQAKAEKTGATMTEDMTKNASEMKSSLSELGLALEGVGNSIINKYAPSITEGIKYGSKWIENNHKIAEGLTEVGTALAVLIAMKPAAWLLRLLGLGKLTKLGPLALLAAVGGAGGEDPEFSKRKNDEYLRDHPPATVESGGTGTLGDWLGRVLPMWMTGRPAGGLPGHGGAGVGADGIFHRGASEGGPPEAGTDASMVAQRTHDFWRSHGYTEEQTAGILAGGPGSESNFNPRVLGDHGSSYGLYQLHNDPSGQGHWHTAQMRNGGNAQLTEQQQNEYVAWQLSPEGPHHEVGARIRASTTSRDSAAIYTGGFGHPQDPMEISRRAAGASRFVGLYDRGPAAGTGGTPAPAAPGTPGANGQVTVDVHLHNVPPGTRATTTTTGNVTSPPARIEHPLPGVH